MAKRTKATKSKMMKVIDWAYDKAVNGGIPGLSTAEELASEFTSGRNRKNNANSLIRWQNAKCATSGFITGLGGLITLPVAIPANISSVLYIQIRMIAAIAHMGGHNLKSDRVRTLAYICLAGSSATDVLKDVGIAVGRKLTEQAIGRLSGASLTRINQQVGFRLLTKFGRTGVVNFGKAIPLIGGIIGGTIDAVATNVIGNVARDTFISAKKRPASTSRS